MMKSQVVHAIVKGVASTQQNKITKIVQVKSRCKNNTHKHFNITKSDGTIGKMYNEIRYCKHVRYVYSMHPKVMPTRCLDKVKGSIPTISKI